jgi:hypothetical protein
VQLSRQFRVGFRRTRQVFAHQLQLEQYVEHLLLLRPPLFQLRALHLVVDDPSGAPRRDAGSSLRRNSPRSFFSK